MIIMKFGGTSVGTAESIDRVTDIVQRRLDQDPVLVVSAHAGVTDLLIEAAENAVEGSASVEALRERHFELIEPFDDPELESTFEELLNELEDLLRGISMVKELTARTRDHVLSFGERLSVRTVASRLEHAGIDAQPVDAYDLGMVTDDEFGSAQPLPEAKKQIRNNLSTIDRLPVVTGFIGKNRDGDITTLGRNGSDYSASYIGAAAGADEIQIWSDVEGVMTADPRIVETAEPIHRMSFPEASELAYYGGRIHPSSLVPAVERDIPIRMLNTFEPDWDGTLILESEPDERTVTSIVHKEGIYLIDIASPNMLARHGFMEKIFRVFAEHEIVIDMVSTSEVSVSCTTDSERNLQDAKEDLSEFCDVEILPDKAIICIVGEGMKNTSDVHQTAFTALNREGIDPQMITQGKQKINLSLIVDEEIAEETVCTLHDALFDGTSS